MVWHVGFRICRAGDLESRVCRGLEFWVSRAYVRGK